MEEAKAVPAGAVWGCCCLQAGVPAGPEWLQGVREYQAEVTGRR